MTWNWISKRRWWQWALVVFGLWLSVVVVSVLRVPKEDFSDLVPRPRPSSVESNAWPLLVKAGEGFGSAGETMRLRSSRTNGVLADPVGIRSVLDSEAAAVGLFQAAARMPVCLRPGTVSFAGRYAMMSNWTAINRLVLLKAELEAQHARSEEAMAGIFGCLELAGKVQDSSVGTYGYLIGTSMKLAALNSLGRVAGGNPGLTESETRDAMNRLDSFSAATSVLANAIKEDLEMSLNEMSGSSRSNNPALGQKKDYFDPQKTRQRAATPMRSAIGSLDSIYAGSPAQRFKPVPRRSLFATAFGGNFLGELISDTKQTQTLEMVVTKCLENNSVRTTKVILAIRLFQQAEKRMPHTLDELVPRFVDSVPADDFDGKPLRYSKDRRIIWSVGKDCVDDGGTRGTWGSKTGHDQVYEIE